MGFIRTLHILKFDKNAKRFTSDTFKKHKNGGISVFDEQCAKETSNNSLCTHIEVFYNTTVGNPICYCKLDLPLFKKTAVLRTWKLLMKKVIAETDAIKICVILLMEQL